MGNSPFKLALMLQSTDLAQILVEKKVDCKLRAYNQASTGFEETERLKDKSLLKEIFRSAQRKSSSDGTKPVSSSVINLATFRTSNVK